MKIIKNSNKTTKTWHLMPRSCALCCKLNNYMCVSDILRQSKILTT